MFKRFSILLMLLLGGMLPPNGLASAAATLSLSDARSLFPKVFDKAIKGELHSVSEEAKSLVHYPLYPYLEAADIEYQMQRQPGSTLDERILAHLQRYPELATRDRIKSAWLVSLHVRKNHRLFLEHFEDNEHDSVSLRCRHISARIALNRNAGLLADAREIWLYGRSRPKTCDAVIDWLEDKGHLSKELIRQRAVLAMQEDQTSLASWLSRKLDKPEAALFERWIKVHRNPVGELKKLSSKPDPSVTAEVIAHGLKRGALIATDKMAEMAPDLIRQYKFSRAQAGDVRRYFGYRYALSRKPESVTWFDKGGNSGVVDELMHAWRVRAALFHGNWRKAREWTAALPESMLKDPEWQYWQARALEATGDRTAARKIYAETARDKGYYHYLAADRLSIPYAIKHVPTPENVLTRDRVESLGGVLRTREWLALDDERRARREWHSLIKHHPDKEMLRHLSALAHRWGWHFEAILTQARSDYWDDLHLRYPLPHRERVMAAGREFGVDPAWIYGIMRSESLFVDDARSPAGAIGLMQLLPSTGRLMASKTGIRARSTAAILKPKNNIRLGSAYLRDMLADHGGNYAMACAAYNAGPHRVKRWRPEEKAIAADIWVTNIPFNETRGYVARVLSHTTAFQWRLGTIITPLHERMPDVHPTQFPNSP